MLFLFLYELKENSQFNNKKVYNNNQLHGCPVQFNNIKPLIQSSKVNSNSNRIVMIADQNLLKPKKKSEHDHNMNINNNNNNYNNYNKNRVNSKSTYNINSNHANNAFCYSGSKKLMKLNSGQILNSLADYNLASLEDKMLHLDIGFLKAQHHYHQQQQIQHSTEMFKNVSFDSLANLKNRKNKNNKLNFNDQFEAYRLESDSLNIENTGKTTEADTSETIIKK